MNLTTDLPAVSDFQAKACVVALQKMFNSNYFDICTLNAVADTLGRRALLCGRDYEALRALHCVHWSDMGRDMSRSVKEKCLELLAIETSVIDMVDEVKPEAPPPAKETRRPRLSLAWWR